MALPRWFVRSATVQLTDVQRSSLLHEDATGQDAALGAQDGARMSRTLRAYHEAAHAVVARAMGCTVAHVKIAAQEDGGDECVHVTPDTYQVPESRPIIGASLRQETTQPERTAMARRQRDVSTATAALAGVALEDIARAVPPLDLLPAREVLDGTTLDGQRLRSRSDIRQAGDAARRQHRTDAGRNQFIARARARAARILLAHWPSLMAVADALLSHGSLDGQAVELLMQESTHQDGLRRPRRQQPRPL